MKRIDAHTTHYDSYLLLLILTTIITTTTTTTTTIKIKVIVLNLMPLGNLKNEQNKNMKNYKIK